MIGLAGAGDLVATALARESRNRRAGELLAAGVPAAEIPAQIGQAVEALESVPLLATALERPASAAPVTGALARLIAGELPLDDWVALVRATVPPPALWRRRPTPRVLGAVVAPAIGRLRRARRSRAARTIGSVARRAQRPLKTARVRVTCCSGQQFVPGLVAGVRRT